MTDEQIIERYLARDERAIGQTDTKYGAYCRQVARRILADDMDVEEIVNDTYLRAWNSIPPNQPQELKLYLAKVVRNLALSRWRIGSAEKRGGNVVLMALDELSECVGGGQEPENALEKQELTASIGEFLRGVPERNRHIFLRRYFYLEDISEIAARYGLKESNVLMILSRTRKKLKAHLIKEGYIYEK